MSSRPAPQPRWQGREIRRFGERDIQTWRGGQWRQGMHNGRRGWWWIAAGVWYYYPAPVYPYPDPYTPAVIVAAPPTQIVVTQPDPPVVVQPQAPAQYWYYCASAQGYYPYVPSCPEAWQQVPAQYATQDPSQ